MCLCWCSGVSYTPVDCLTKPPTAPPMPPITAPPDAAPTVNTLTLFLAYQEIKPLASWFERWIQRSQKRDSHLGTSAVGTLVLVMQIGMSSNSSSVKADSVKIGLMFLVILLYHQEQYTW